MGFFYYELYLAYDNHSMKSGILGYLAGHSWYVGNGLLFYMGSVFVLVFLGQLS
jgi:hypothetical protein